MSHDLEVDEFGKASMVYNAKYGDPWHRLGTPIDGNMTPAEALEVARADYTVTKQPLTVNIPNPAFDPFAPFPTDEYIEFDDQIETFSLGVEKKIATVRINPLTGAPQVLGILGSNYGVVQNREIMDKAYAVVGAAEGSAYVDTAGVILDGRRFFAYVRLEDLVVDPVGIADTIERGLAVYTSHDGTVSATFAFTDIRAVCRNTITFGIENATRLFKAKHTSNVLSAMDEAQKVLGVSTEWAEQFKAQSERLLRVPFNNDRFEAILKATFPLAPNPTDRQVKSNKKTHAHIRGIFANERNSANFGESGWTMYNSIVEYLDHGRGGDDEDRMVVTMTPGSWVDKRKEKAAGLILASV